MRHLDKTAIELGHSGDMGDRPACRSASLRIQRLRGLQGLIHDAVDAVTELVDVGDESASRSVLAVTDRVPGVAGAARSIEGLRRGVARGVTTAIRGVNRGLEAASGFADHAAGRRASPSSAEGFDRLRSRTSPSEGVDAVCGWLNGAVGDRLVGREGLDQGMELFARGHRLDLRAGGSTVALPGVARRVAVFVHGLGMTERSWVRDTDGSGDPGGVPFGELLERDLDIVPLYVRYNSGRHIAENGRALAQLLARLVEESLLPFEDLILVGHSMGGLVIRSACHFGAESDAAWSHRVSHVVCLGSPHRGAPLAKVSRIAERAFGAVDLPATQVLARVVGGRSDGIRDLHDGTILDGEQVVLEGERPRGASILPGARHCFLAATITRDSGHPVGRAFGDLLVRQVSASGPRVEGERAEVETHCLGGVSHLELTTHPAVYEILRRFLARN